MHVYPLFFLHVASTMRAKFTIHRTTMLPGVKLYNKLRTRINCSFRRATHWNKDWRGPIGGWSPVMACLVETTASGQWTAGRQQRRIAPGAMLDGYRPNQQKNKSAMAPKSGSCRARRLPSRHQSCRMHDQLPSVVPLFCGCATCLCLVLQSRTSFFS